MLVDTHGHTSFSAHNSRRRVKRGATEGSSPPWTSTASGTLPRFISNNGGLHIQESTVWRGVFPSTFSGGHSPFAGEGNTLSHLTKHGSTCT
jgi:hypothetical protein